MNRSHYETTNIYLASYLLSAGTVLADFRHVSPRRVQFRFVSDVNLHGLLRLYWNNASIPLVPSALFGSLQRLKSISRRHPLASGTKDETPKDGSAAAVAVGERTTPSIDDSPTGPC